MSSAHRKDARARRWISHWSHALSIATTIQLERTSIWHVTDDRGRAGCSLVGVVLDAEGACIYHTRRLTQEDVVHELLHVAHPAWTEAQVIAETTRLLPDRSHRESLSKSLLQQDKNKGETYAIQRHIPEIRSHLLPAQHDRSDQKR